MKRKHIKTSVAAMPNAGMAAVAGRVLKVMTVSFRLALY